MSWLYIDNIYFRVALSRVHCFILSQHSGTPWILRIDLSIILPLEPPKILITSAWLIHHLIKPIIFFFLSNLCLSVLWIVFFIIALGFFLKHGVSFLVIIFLLLIEVILLLILFFTSLFLFFLLIFFTLLIFLYFFKFLWLLLWFFFRLFCINFIE